LSERAAERSHRTSKERGRASTGAGASNEAKITTRKLGEKEKKEFLLVLASVKLILVKEDNDYMIESFMMLLLLLLLLTTTATMMIIQPIKRKDEDQFSAIK
jgi:hypothetical protein